MKQLMLFGGLVLMPWVLVEEQTVTYAADGHQRATFELIDQGRGPQLTKIMQLDATGQMKQFQVSGHSFMGAAVNERFQLDGQQASWQSVDEAG